MPKKYFRKYLPTAESIRANRWLRWLGRHLDRPGIWHLNRRSVAGAVAIGLFSGLVPGPLQMLSAALLAVPLRKNLPVALFVTLYTNPLTIVPLYMLAYGIGRLLVGGDGGTIPAPYTMDWSSPLASAAALFEWMVALGTPLAVGLLALALGSAALGYAVVDLGWRAWVAAQLRARRRRRHA